MSVAWGGGVLGWSCAQMLDREPLPFSVLYTIPRRIGWFLTDLGHHPGMLMVVACFGFAVASDIWRHKVSGWLTSFWSVFAAAAALSSLTLTMLLYEGIPIYRYALPFLWWTVILIAAELARITSGRPILLRLPVAATACVLALAYLATGLHVPGLLRWELPLASCLQSAGLRAGLADYWSARLINAASNWQLQVEQISESGGARVWGNDRFWYTRDIHHGLQRPPYQFIVMDALPADQIAVAYGQPDRVLLCDPGTIWIYDNSDRLYVNLVRASRSMPKVFTSAPASRLREDSTSKGASPLILVTN